VASEAELRDRIASDRAISRETRETALRLAGEVWATRIHGLVSSRFARLLLPADVLDALRADPALHPEVRATVLGLAETWPESAAALNGAAWELAKVPCSFESDFRRGLRLAEEACKIEPGNRAYLNTMGMAQYRTGQYEKARATLTRSNQLNANRAPADLAFLAMTQQRLDQIEPARSTLMRLREVMKDPAVAVNPEYQWFLREAESVILGSSELPEDVFAP
jgi:tetratricopeptide (TPR) repeat protein